MDKTPEERAEAWHDRYQWKATGLPVDASAIAGLAKTIREAENAAYERAAMVCEVRGQKFKEMNEPIAGLACDSCSGDIRALKHGDGEE